MEGGCVGEGGEMERLCRCGGERWMGVCVGEGGRGRGLQTGKEYGADGCGS